MVFFTDTPPEELYPNVRTLSTVLDVLKQNDATLEALSYDPEFQDTEVDVTAFEVDLSFSSALMPGVLKRLQELGFYDVPMRVDANNVLATVTFMIETVEELYQVVRFEMYLTENLVMKYIVDAQLELDQWKDEHPGLARMRNIPVLRIGRIPSIEEALEHLHAYYDSNGLTPPE